MEILKYPRTPHLEGSKLQQGDEDLNHVKFSDVKNKYLVIEEKMDGANCGISFGENRKLLLQSRGHFLNGGFSEAQFELFKAYGNNFSYELYNLLGKRYIMYGEWLYAKHTVFYDMLPHYFMEFDIYDKERKIFLSTNKRREMLKEFKFINSVLVLKTGCFQNLDDIKNILSKSNFKSENWIDKLSFQCSKLSLNFDLAKTQTDSSDLMEGLYIKEEDDDKVKSRFKFVRQSFLNTILDSETHWASRPIIPNILEETAGVFNNE